MHRLSTHGVWAARDEKERGKRTGGRERRKWAEERRARRRVGRAPGTHVARGCKSGATESPGGTRKHVHTRHKRRRRVT